MTPDIWPLLQSALGDGYRLEREIGGGGMSRVFLVEDAALQRHIVVKLLPPEMAAEVSIARFQREVSLAARLQHPHIVPLLATGEADGLPYFTMPYVEGESLRDRLTRVGELPVSDVVRLIREIATALGYAHERGIVHRDIKPENVLLSNGVALVADFGVAKALIASATSGGGRLTTNGVAIGTPAYMSPEQVGAEPGVDHRADLYSLGMVAYEMLAGRTPFAGRNAQAAMSAHMIETPEPIDKLRPAVPPALAAIVMRCLEKRPADRPQSASEVVQALDAAALSTQVTARLPVRRIYSRVALLVGAAVVVLASGGAWWSFRRRSAKAVAAPSRLLIAPFENLTGDPRFNYVGRVAADRLALGVSQGSTIDVVPSNMVLMALKDSTGANSQQIERLATASHAGLLVSGTVARRGDTLVLQAQLTEARTGKLIAPLDPAGSPADDPIAAVDAIRDRLLSALGGRDLKILPQGAYHIPKNAAYQEYAKAFDRFVVQGDMVGSRPFLRRAIAIDSAFARAYVMLAQLYLNSDEFAPADSILRQLEASPQNLSATERLQVQYLRAELDGDVAASLRVEQQLALRDSSALALELVGEAANFLLRPDLAIPAFENAHATMLLVGGWAARSHTYRLTDAYHLAGRHDAEMKALLDNRSVFPNDFELRARQLRVYGATGRAASALATTDTLLRGDVSGVSLRGIAEGAQEFRAHGDSATAARLIVMARAWIAAHPQRHPSPDRQLREGVVLLAAGMSDSAALRFVALSRSTKLVYAAGYLGLARVALGDRAGARAIADSIGALSGKWRTGEHTYWRAAIVGALGDRDLAMQLLRQSQREGRYMLDWHYTDALDALHGYKPFETLVRATR